MSEKTIVLTMYGNGEKIENISISLFDRNESYYSASINNAMDYCENINGLELKDDKWIHARIIGENKKIILEKPFKFDILNKLNDRSLQKVLREVSNRVLAMALLETNETIKERIFENMSKRSSRMLIEDMESLNDITSKEIKEAQNVIIEMIHKLSNNGEVVFSFESDFVKKVI